MTDILQGGSLLFKPFCCGRPFLFAWSVKLNDNSFYDHSGCRNQPRSRCGGVPCAGVHDGPQRLLRLLEKCACHILFTTDKLTQEKYFPPSRLLLQSPAACSFSSFKAIWKERKLSFLFAAKPDTIPNEDWLQALVEATWGTIWL